MDEKWRKIPETKYSLSNIGRLKNRRGRHVTPRIVCGSTRARYDFYVHGVHKSFFVEEIMDRVWPEVGRQVYDEEWIAMVRHMNGLPSETMTTSRRPWRPTSWDRDPWESMRLWESERDFFSFAQYVPVI
jgi:hypothetical protein